MVRAFAKRDMALRRITKLLKTPMFELAESLFLVDLEKLRSNGDEMKSCNLALNDLDWRAEEEKHAHPANLVEFLPALKNVVFN